MKYFHKFGEYVMYHPWNWTGILIAFHAVMTAWLGLWWFAAIGLLNVSVFHVMWLKANSALRAMHEAGKDSP